MVIRVRVTDITGEGGMKLVCISDTHSLHRRIPEPDSQGRPENPAETRSRSLRPGAPHHGDLDRRVPATAGRLRAQGALLRHLGRHHTGLQAEAALDEWIAT